MSRSDQPTSRRRFLADVAAATGALALGAPWVVRSAGALQLKFRTIKDPDGWYPSLRLKGDWLVLEVTDGVLSGYGEASQSNDDERCKQAATAIFAQHYRDFVPSLERLAAKEREIAALTPDLVTQAAYSGLNQAFYDLLAKREQVPVWRLFRDKPAFEGLPLYTTINRALEKRTTEEYDEVVGALASRGFGIYKCAPFEAVNGPEHAIEKAAAGLTLLTHLREKFPQLRVRVDFHERFQPHDFYELIPQFEKLDIDWLEEPFRVGPTYTELRQKTRLRLSGGELFWGRQRFEEIANAKWVDVIMPDVKYVGGFGPLLDVLVMGRGKIEISPHNPSGPISTAASMHAACVHPETVRALEYSFDRRETRRATGETIENGVLRLTDKPGWGVAPPA
ncbi:MAG TPA: enolase C-terminal domain-like protein [Gammaproteobacteria bacterium]|jgi:galactonate dehydratase|nr:enolase C-terminal domain-like protein [Gammaproteobacteria bacterium]